MTELVELHSAAPLLYVLFVPGNPGVIPFYKDFLESLYKILDEKASVIGIGHIGHTKKNWEKGRLFSLEDQINHKISFMKQELQSTKTPIVLVGHSIGAYIALEVFKRLPQQVAYVVDLFPFLAIDRKSSEQRKVDTITRISPLCSFLSLIVAVLGVFPSCIKNIVIKEGMGKLWSSSAVGATRSHLLKYHMIRNLFHMAMTEFDDVGTSGKMIAVLS